MPSIFTLKGLLLKLFDNSGLAKPHRPMRDDELLEQLVKAGAFLACFRTGMNAIRVSIPFDGAVRALTSFSDAPAMSAMPDPRSPQESFATFNIFAAVFGALGEIVDVARFGSIHRGTFTSSTLAFPLVSFGLSIFVAHTIHLEVT